MRKKAKVVINQNLKKLLTEPSVIEIANQDSIHKTLSERGKRYGSFDKHAEITQDLKETMKMFRKTGNINDYRPWTTLSFAQKEALEMIMHKVGRILNGDPNYKDSWRDIAGYATLIADTLKDGN